MADRTLRVFIEMSTLHLTPRTRLCFRGNDPEAWPVWGGRIPDGWFVYCADEKDAEITDDLWTCIEYARRHGASYIRFDEETGPQADLPSYPEHGVAA